MGYNLAMEYLADYEKTWMLDSFRELHSKHIPHDIEWCFLTVRAHLIGRLELNTFLAAPASFWKG